MPSETVMILIAAVVILFTFVMMLVTRYKRCPSNRILVKYGKVSGELSSQCYHGGGAFIWPLIQDYAYLHLDPVQIEVPLKGALSMENIRVNVPSVFTVAIGTTPDTMSNAAIRLLGLTTPEVMKQAEDIIFGQLRQVIASMKIEDINRDRDSFLDKIQSSLEPELEKIGLVLINVNITDITDESGYIAAIGRKAAAEAVQQAQIDVSVQEKKGAIGVAAAERERAIEVANAMKLQQIGTKEAEREQAVQVAILQKEREVGEQKARFEQESQVRDAERQMRVDVADANARAVAGENASKALVAATNAELAVKEAEAYQIGESRRREADAAVREAQYVAETRAAQAQASKIEAEKRAELEAVAKAEKARLIVDAEASAEQRRIVAEGEAKAIFARLDAEARGQYEILAQKGEGLRRIVDACGSSQSAFQLLMLEQLGTLSENAAKAISNIKFDKVVVWDSGRGGKDGQSATSGFLQSLGQSLPPMLQMMKDVGGVEMPEFFGKLTGERASPKDGGGGEGEADVAAAKKQGGPSGTPGKPDGQDSGRQKKHGGDSPDPA